MAKEKQKERRKEDRRSGKERRINGTAATQLLKEDHLRINDYFDDLEDTEDPDMMREIRDLLLAEVRAHRAVLEDVFYPAIEDLMETELLEDARTDLESWEAMLENLERAEPEESAFREVWQKLRREMTHHISWEEQEMLNKLEDEEDIDLIQLGIRITELKREVLAEQPTLSWDAEANDRSGS